jgi:hypothetical protein
MAGSLRGAEAQEAERRRLHALIGELVLWENNEVDAE